LRVFPCKVLARVASNRPFNWTKNVKNIIKNKGIRNSREQFHRLEIEAGIDPTGFSPTESIDVNKWELSKVFIGKNVRGFLSFAEIFS